MLKEKLPALLASRQGLCVACGIFNIIDAKDRKNAIKSLPVEELIKNKIGHLFLIHIANTLDDTQLTKKKILHEALKLVDDLISDKFYQSVLISALSQKNPLLTQAELQAFETLQHLSTSKKDKNTRALELFKITAKPLEVFFEEKLQYYIQGINQQPVLRTLCQQICHCKLGSTSHIRPLLPPREA